jgi:hypothetical protein
VRKCRHFNRSRTARTGCALGRSALLPAVILSRSVFEELHHLRRAKDALRHGDSLKKDSRATKPAGKAEVETWFVSTAEKSPGEPHFALIWTMAEFETEAAARRYAKNALNRGLRVEAGTLLGPQIHVPWRKAVASAASGERRGRSPPANHPEQVGARRPQAKALASAT